MSVLRPPLASASSALGRILTQNSPDKFFMGQASVPTQHFRKLHIETYRLSPWQINKLGHPPL
jgi:hypothetical protein